MYELPWSGIPPYPIKHFSFVNRVAVLAANEGWCPQYVRAAYRRWFVNGDDPSIETNLSSALTEIGQDPARVLALATSDKITVALKSQTDTARALEIFGSPTFFTGNEIFWGDDRLEDAIQWCRQSRKIQPPISDAAARR